MRESHVPLADQASIMDTADKINYVCALIFTTEHDRKMSPTNFILPVGTTYRENEALA